MLRAFVVVVGVAMALCGVILTLVSPPVWPAGLELLIFGLLIVFGTVFERWQYRKRVQRDRGTWQDTGERFRDPIGGTLIEVDYNPATGERDYRPIG
jgi:hypothetical protein